MKIKARCPHCEIAQMFHADPQTTTAEVVCHMDWCRKTFIPTKSNLGNNYTIKEDSIEDLKNATAREPSPGPIQ